MQRYKNSEDDHELLRARNRPGLATSTDEQQGWQADQGQKQQERRSRTKIISGWCKQSPFTFLHDLWRRRWRRDLSQEKEQEVQVNRSYLQGYRTSAAGFCLQQEEETFLLIMVDCFS